jgi:hypothetical protein
MRYALRKRDQKWLVSSGQTRAVEFDEFDEAFAVAWNAARLLRETGVRQQETETPAKAEDLTTGERG